MDACRSCRTASAAPASSCMRAAISERSVSVAEAWSATARVIIVCAPLSSAMSRFDSLHTSPLSVPEMLSLCGRVSGHPCGRFPTPAHMHVYMCRVIWPHR